MLVLTEGDSIYEAVEGLPEYCCSSFKEISPLTWNGQFIVTCPVAPELADGDFETDLSPYFPILLNLKTLYDATFEMNITIGSPGPTSFTLASHSIAILAALGSKIAISQNTAEQGAAANP